MNDFTKEEIKLDLNLMRLKRIYGSLHQEQDSLMKLKNEATEEVDKLQVQLFLMGFNRALRIFEDGVDE